MQQLRSCSLCHDCLEEYFIRCLVTKCFSWSVIEAIYYHLNMSLGDSVKAHSFREVLANKAIGIFTKPTLPCMIGMGEVDRGV